MTVYVFDLPAQVTIIDSTSVSDVQVIVVPVKVTSFNFVVITAPVLSAVTVSVEVASVMFAV